MMSESTAGIWIGGETLGEGRRRPLVLVLLIGILLGALLWTSVTAWTGDRTGRADAGQPAASVREWPDHPIPREWRWEREPYTFDYMFRKDR